MRLRRRIGELPSVPIYPYLFCPYLSSLSILWSLARRERLRMDDPQRHAAVGRLCNYDRRNQGGLGRGYVYFG